MKIKHLIAILFFGLICWTIYQVDKGITPAPVAIVKQIPFGDKVAHFLIYGLFAFVVCFATDFHRTSWMKKEFLTGSALILFFAILEEFTQIAFVTRNFDLIDMLCDVVGVFLFTKLAIWIYRSKLQTAFNL